MFDFLIFIKPLGDFAILFQNGLPHTTYFLLLFGSARLSEVEREVDLIRVLLNVAALDLLQLFIIPQRKEESVLQGLHLVSELREESDGPSIIDSVSQLVLVVFRYPFRGLAQKHVFLDRRMLFDGQRKISGRVFVLIARLKGQEDALV